MSLAQTRRMVGDSMQVGDLVCWTEDRNLIGIIVGTWSCIFNGVTGFWVLLVDGRKELFDPTQLEIA